ncbi:MAG: hypothetical protein AB1453_13875 [Chloroflexota bacterium]
MKLKLFFFCLSLVSLILLSAALLPAPRQVWQASVSGETAVGGLDDLPSTRQVFYFSYPRWVRINQAESLQLMLKQGDSSLSAPLLWVARVEIPGARLQPEGVQQQAYLPGGENRFRWTITPFDDRLASAMLWVYLRPAEAGGEEKATLIAAHPFSIQVISLLPQGGWQAIQWLAGFGLISGILGLGLLYKPRLS